MTLPSSEVTHVIVVYLISVGTIVGLLGGRVNERGHGAAHAGALYLGFPGVDWGTTVGAPPLDAAAH